MAAEDVVPAAETRFRRVRRTPAFSVRVRARSNEPLLTPRAPAAASRGTQAKKPSKWPKGRLRAAHSCGLAAALGSRTLRPSRASRRASLADRSISAMKFQRFSLRGEAKARGEWTSCASRSTPDDREALRGMRRPLSALRCTSSLRSRSKGSVLPLTPARTLFATTCTSDLARISVGESWVKLLVLRILRSCTGPSCLASHLAIRWSARERCAPVHRMHGPGRPRLSRLSRSGLRLTRRRASSRPRRMASGQVR